MKIHLKNFVIGKMQTSFTKETKNNVFTTILPQYFLTEDVEVFINKKIKITHELKYICIGCNKSAKKLYSGFCYLCLIRKPEADLCIVSPHRCHYLAGTCRSKEFGQEFCFQPHYLYLASTDKFKVGLTRHTQIPTRWIDQGATLASVFLKTHSRHQAGIIEKFLTQKIADKSHWKNMLLSQNVHPTHDDFLKELNQIKTWLTEHPLWLSDDLKAQSPEDLNIEHELSILNDSEVYEIIYPFLDEFPMKLQSVKLDKYPQIEGVIIGIKGQYIILDNGIVINLRNHSGYLVDIEIDG